MTVKLLLMAAGLMLSVSSASASIYNFTQDGYAEGATISGSFTVNDLDSSGYIKVGNSGIFGSGYNFNEISAFSLSFSGNSIVSAFTQGLADLSILIYKNNTPLLGDEIISYPSIQEAIGTNWYGASGFDYTSGIGTGGLGGNVSNIVTGAISYSENAVNVSAVPVPGAVWLFGSALAGFIGAARRKMQLA